MSTTLGKLVRTKGPETKGKEKEKEKEKEEVKYLRLHLQQLAEENETLRQRLDDEKAASVLNKQLLGGSVG